jgi:hypothetical protein
VSAAPLDVQQLAQRIFDRQLENRVDSAEVASAIEQTFARLEQPMMAMVGEVGFRAVMARALHLTRAALPKEALPPSATAVSGSNGGWSVAVESAGIERARVSAEALLAQVLGLMRSFIGEDLTVRTVRRAWTDLTASAEGSESGEA